MCHPAEFIRYLRRFNATVVLSYTAYYPGVEVLGLANTVSREDLELEIAAAGFRSHMVASVNLPFHNIDAGINDIPQMIFLLEPDTSEPAELSAYLRGRSRGAQIAIVTNASSTQNTDFVTAISSSPPSHLPVASNFHPGGRVPGLMLRRRLGAEDTLEPTFV